MHYKQNNKESKTYVQGLRSFGNTLPRGIKGILKKSGYNYSEIISRWSYLVGKEMSSYCYPKSIKTGREFKDGILHLNVFHGDQLLVGYNKTNIIEKINVFFGYQFVKDIRIILIKERIDPKKYIILKNNKDSKYQKNLAKIKNPELKKKINNLINAFSNKK